MIRKPHDHPRFRRQTDRSSLANGAAEGRWSSSPAPVAVAQRIAATTPGLDETRRGGRAAVAGIRLPHRPERARALAIRAGCFGRTLLLIAVTDIERVFAGPKNDWSSWTDPAWLGGLLPQRLGQTHLLLPRLRRLGGEWCARFARSTRGAPWNRHSSPRLRSSSPT